MGICNFKSFRKWLVTPLMLLSATTAQAQSSSGFRSLSLEESLSRKAEIISVTTNRVESTSEIRVRYAPDDKTIFVNAISNQNGKGEYVGLNERDSKLYIIAPRDNFEFDYIVQYGFFPENEGEKWERLIPEDKNPSAKIKSFISGKSISEIFKVIGLTGSKSIFEEFIDYLAGEKELSIEKMAYELGEDYEVREIPIHTSEGMLFRPISNLEVRIKLETNPRERKKAVVVVDFSYLIRNSQKILKNRNVVTIPCIVPGERERDVKEQDLEGKIMETVSELDDKEEYREYLKKVPLRFRKYFPFKEEIPEDFTLESFGYWVDVNREAPILSSEVFQIMVGDIKRASDERGSFWRISVVKTKKEKQPEFSIDFFAPYNTEPYDVFYNKADDVYVIKSLSDYHKLPQEYIKRLNLEPLK
jgi:hypothetical protein